MRQTLVTGGAGFVGSHLVQALLARGDAVRVLDDLSTGQEENLAGLDVELVVGDVSDMPLVRQVMEGVETVFHQAALVSVALSMEDPLRCYRVNLQGTLNLLWAAHRAGAKRVVVASSAAVYGESGGALVESDSPRPKSPYAASKLAAEGAAQLFSEAYGLPTVCLRYFNVYGPRQRPDSPYAAVIPRFIQACLAGEAPTVFGDGGQTRDFVYVGDVVQANLLAAEHRGPEAAVFNVGSGRSVSILGLAALLQRLIPGAPPATFGPSRPGDIRFSQADIRAAQEALGYRPRIALEQGLQRTVEWFQALGQPSRS